MPEITVTGKVAQKKEKNDKFKYSSFFLTINLNQRYKPNDPQLQNDITFFDELINTILNDIPQYVKLPAGVEWNDDTINDVNIDYVIEIAPKTQSLHSHILLNFKHNTSIKLDFTKIKKKILQETGLKNIYLHNRMSKNNNANLLDYIEKYT